VPADRLVLEVTEDTVMSDPERALDVLARLSESGVALALDDYGTGYSSLSYLKRLPIRELKIDRSFIFDLDTDPDAATIVRSTIEMANNLDLQVTAEGVETAASWTTLDAMGARHAQGYLLTKPLPADELDAWIATWQPPSHAATCGEGLSVAPRPARAVR
jgi:EAL domain-containing protein (putative c-di-GMP-specific phosphodiesterase class I)